MTLSAEMEHVHKMICAWLWVYVHGTHASPRFLSLGLLLFQCFILLACTMLPLPSFPLYLSFLLFFLDHVKL